MWRLWQIFDPRQVLVGLFAFSITHGQCESIESLELPKTISSLVSPWNFKSGDPIWKFTTSRELPDGSIFSSGSAYLIFEAPGAHRADFEKTTDLIRDYFKDQFVVKDATTSGSQNGGASGSDAKPLSGSDYRASVWQASSKTEFFSIQVRAVPLQSGLVGILLSYDRIAPE